MKICIIGPGIMSIPPTGWGAVEILIWDYKETLEKLGVSVKIVNTRDNQEIIDQTNEFAPDFIHIQYDEFYHLENSFNCKNVAVTSHYGYLDQPSKHGGYSHLFRGFLDMKCAYIFSLSPTNTREYINSGFPPERIFTIPNGARDDLFNFREECKLPDSSLYLAKVDYRKRQHLFHDLPNLFFAGNIADGRYNKKNYLGEWSKPTLYEHLTDFSNLVLLSDGEGHPLVCLEAMMAGLGLVISEYACANLNTSLPFIDVIPENKIMDIYYVSDTIKSNRSKSIKLRKEIRQYCIDNFSWNKIVGDYLSIVISIINNKKFTQIEKNND